MHVGKILEPTNAAGCPYGALHVMGLASGLPVKSRVWVKETSLSPLCSFFYTFIK